MSNLKRRDRDKRAKGGKGGRPDKQREKARSYRRRWRPLVVAGLLLSLLATGGILAQRGSSRQGAQTGRGLSPDQEAPSAALNPNSPSKEYVYAGGRLLATEEPVSSGCTPLETPTGLAATAGFSPLRVDLTWNPTPGADHYEVQRRTNSGYAPLLPNPLTNSFHDMTVTAGTAYLYQVRAVDVSGNCPSPYSAADLATTISFTDDPLQAGTAIKADHVYELRAAVNAVRATANLGAAVWTDASLQGVAVKAAHITELRTNLDQALAALGFSTQAYADSPLVQFQTQVKASHINELRQRVK